jgi:hypothetical protein
LVTQPLLAELAGVIGEVLGWSTEEQQAEVARTISLLEQRHRVRF